MEKTPLISPARRVAVALLILAGLGLLGRYTAYLYREDLRDWRRVDVLFEDVGGLRTKDDVLVGGTRVGRVAAVALFEDLQLVTLEVLPELELRADAAVKIVSANSLGFVDVELHPGSRHAPPLPPGTRLRGTVFVGVGQGAPEPGRARQLSRGLHAFALETGRIRDPASGAWGAALYDRDRAEALGEGLRRLADQWRGADAALARLEVGEGIGAALDRDALEEVLTTLGGARAALTTVSRGLAAAARGDGQTGRVFGDPVEARAWRDATGRLAGLLAGARLGEGTLGALTHPSRGQDLPDAIDPWERATRDGVEGRGLLGLLSSPEGGDAARQALRGARRGLEGLERSPLVRDREARFQLHDAAAGVGDAVKNLRRVVHNLRADLPTRSSFTGAIFAIF